MDDRLRYSKATLIGYVPHFVEAHWPKNKTAKQGGPATPGRGEAAVTLTRFIHELPLEEMPQIPKLAEQAYFTYRMTTMELDPKATYIPEWKDLSNAQKNGLCEAVEEVLRRA